MSPVVAVAMVVVTGGCRIQDELDRLEQEEADSRQNYDDIVQQVLQVGGSNRLINF